MPARRSGTPSVRLVRGRERHLVKPHQRLNRQLNLDTAQAAALRLFAHAAVLASTRLRCSGFVRYRHLS